MSQCVSATIEGYLVQSQVCDYVMLTQDEYTALSIDSIVPLIKMYFEFDVALAGQLSGLFCLTFFSGHALGRIVRTMGKHS